MYTTKFHSLHIAGLEQFHTEPISYKINGIYSEKALLRVKNLFVYNSKKEIFACSVWGSVVLLNDVSLRSWIQLADAKPGSARGPDISVIRTSLEAAIVRAQ